ncbi:caspase-1-like isoform 2-T2 [Odontesthes bonariensis]|uniref:caspase-1-like isoform X2 n=1 Tax=Odontesthes bonariensis TaxID=219752 RepID=UPI003F58C5D1
MADKELSRVRAEFVKKVSKAGLSELLDVLLEDGVFNELEKESILEEHNTKADKARALIDDVKKKGPEASRKMIDRLEKIDNHLYSLLSLSCGQPPQPAAEPQLEQGSSATCHTMEELWKKNQSEPDNIYPVTKAAFRSRVALLITNIKFSVESLYRSGAERDEENMEKLLSSFGYDVVKHTNLTGKGIDDALREFAKHPKLKSTDSAFVIIMSHGKREFILGVNHKAEEPDEFPIDNIYKYLGSQHCPALLNKPKIIIIQACRGDQKGSAFVSDSANNAEAVPEVFEEDTLKCVHKEKDFAPFLSCTPDTVSYRQKEHGSVLIQYIDEVFKGSARQLDILTLFTKVMKRFEDFAIHNRRQMATIDRCTLTKHFYFYPGLLDTSQS